LIPYTHAPAFVQ